MKTLFYALLLTTGLAGAATTARAQSSFSIGPRLEANMATVAISDENSAQANLRNLFGPQIGLTPDMGFGGRFAFQPSLRYSQKGFKTSESGTESFNGTTVTYPGTSTLLVNYLELPLNFVFTTGGTQGFQVFAGPLPGHGRRRQSALRILGLFLNKKSVVFQAVFGAKNFGY